MRRGSAKTVPAPAAREAGVRAVVVCRPPASLDPKVAERLGSSVGSHGSKLGSSAGSAGGLFAELGIHPPLHLAPDTPDADLLRDITAGRDVARLPLYGYRGADNAQLCQREVAPMLQCLLAGESVAIIAYGQTGSGKSYTMGTERYDVGQEPNSFSVGSFCAQRVFDLAQEKGVKDLDVSFSAIEIYREGKDKERLFDLQTLHRKRIDSFESQACWHRAASPLDLKRKLQDSSFLRNTDRTDGNARSSRSHAIFVTQVQFKRVQDDGSIQRIKARLMLVDLAGSERAALAQAGSTSQKQGSGINVGLLYLGMVIKELAERGTTLGYNNSTLTKILKPALGGGSNEVTSSCNTLILGCISPLALHLVNTRSTLEFLQQAQTVKNLVRADVQMLRQQELEAQVERLEWQLRGMELQLKQQHDEHQRQLQLLGVANSIPSSPDIPPSKPITIPAMPFAPSSYTSSDAEAEERLAALVREVAFLRQQVVEQRERADGFEEIVRQQAAAAAGQGASPKNGTAVKPEALADMGGGAAMNGIATSNGPVESPTAAVAAELLMDPLGALSLHENRSGAASPPAEAAATATPLTGARPSAAAFLAASPLLAASRDVAQWVAEAAATEAAAPAGQQPSIVELLPSAEELCWELESHMPEDQLQPVKEKVARLLDAAQGGDDRAQAMAFAEASLYVVGAYNQCLGEAITSAEDAIEDKETEQEQHAREFAQLYAEKMQYMKRTAAAEGGLARYEEQVEELRSQLAAAEEALQAERMQQQGPPQATPRGGSAWNSIGWLLGGTSRSPARSTASTPASSIGPVDSWRTRNASASPQPSPYGAGGRSATPGTMPRGPSSMSQQPYGSAGRPGQPPSYAAGQGYADPRGLGGGSGSRMTIGCVQQMDMQQQQQAAALATEASLEAKRQKALSLLVESSEASMGEIEGSSGSEADFKIKALLAPDAVAVPTDEPRPAAAPAEAAAVAAELVQQQVQQVHLDAQGVQERSSGKQAVEQQHRHQQQQQEQQGQEEEVEAVCADAAVAQEQQGDVDTPLESPEVSCIVAGRSSSDHDGMDGSRRSSGTNAACEGAAAAATAAVPECSAKQDGGDAPQSQRFDDDDMAVIDVVPVQELAADASMAEASFGCTEDAEPAGQATAPAQAQQPNAAGQGQQEQREQAAADDLQPEPPHDQQPPALQPAAGEQQQQQQQEQQQQQQQQLGEERPDGASQEPAGQQPKGKVLPGPRVLVQVPCGRTWQRYDYEPSTQRFFAEGTEKEAHPLQRLLAHDGQSWQHRVLLSGSSITLEQWLHRRMLRPGRCHFCCTSAPDPSCRHPEAAFHELQLCTGCHAQLEPESWRIGDAWHPEDPEDGLKWCCMCAGAGVGNTDDMLLCDTCRTCGFCTGCLWRFTADDLAPLQDEDAPFECLLCRTAPRLNLVYVEGDAGSGWESSSKAGKARRNGRAGTQPPSPPSQPPATQGLRRSSRRRQAVQQEEVEVVVIDSDAEIVVDLTGSGSEAESEEAAPAQHHAPVQPQAAAAHKAAGHARGGREQAGVAAAGAVSQQQSQMQEPASASQGQEGAQGQQEGQGQLAAVRKRSRKLLRQGDIAASPGTDGDSPALHRQRMQQRRQLQGAVNTAAISSLRGDRVHWAGVAKKNPMWKPAQDKLKAMQAL